MRTGSNYLKTLPSTVEYSSTLQKNMNSFTLPTNFYFWQLRSRVSAVKHDVVTSRRCCDRRRRAAAQGQSVIVALILILGVKADIGESIRPHSFDDQPEAERVRLRAALTNPPPGSERDDSRRTRMRLFRSAAAKPEKRQPVYLNVLRPSW
jgi:hypothetical protein